MVTLEGETFGLRRDRDTLYDPGVVPLPLEPLLRRLSDVTAAAFYPLLEKRSAGGGGSGGSGGRDGIGE